MHKSRLAGIIIDCKDADLDEAAHFWSKVLGLPRLGKQGSDNYEGLDGSARDVTVEVQDVRHESRVHIDIESDDIEAEVKRLEALGARRLENISTWVVLESPTGQRFCVIRAKKPLAGVPGANTWG